MKRNLFIRVCLSLFLASLLLTVSTSDFAAQADRVPDLKVSYLWSEYTEGMGHLGLSKELFFLDGKSQWEWNSDSHMGSIIFGMSKNLLEWSIRYKDQGKNYLPTMLTPKSCRDQHCYYEVPGEQKGFGFVLWQDPLKDDNSIEWLKFVAIATGIHPEGTPEGKCVFLPLPPSVIEKLTGYKDATSDNPWRVLGAC